MKVSSSTNVISPQVGGALMYIGKKREDPVMITTGWFIKLLRRWFTIVTSRTHSTALSYHNKEAYDNAIEVMQLICDIFGRSTFDSGWKVTQTHIIMACRALLEIQRVLLNEGKYRYICLGNFTQDSIENIFSCIRIQRPKPSALDFKFRLKQCVLGGIAIKVTNSSYSQEDDPPSLIALLSTAKAQSNQNLTSPPELESSLAFTKLENCPDITDVDKDVLYRMSGYVLLKMKKRLKCMLCFESLLHQEDDVHRHAGLTIETDIKSGAQVRVVNSLFELFVAVERLLVASIHLLPQMHPCDKAALTRHIVSTVQHFHLPTCHNVKSGLIGRFLSMRFSQLSRYLTKFVTPVSTPFGSRSMGMRVLADNFNGSGRR